ncbi:hypothetical protein ACB092_06G007300 [Castanea dentata]
MPSHHPKFWTSGQYTPIHHSHSSKTHLQPPQLENYPPLIPKTKKSKETTGSSQQIQRRILKKETHHQPPTSKNQNTENSLPPHQRHTQTTNTTKNTSHYQIPSYSENSKKGLKLNHQQQPSQRNTSSNNKESRPTQWRALGPTRRRSITKDPRFGTATRLGLVMAPEMVSSARNSAARH